MYTMRRSTDADIPRERELWRMSFGDDWDYIDTYYDHTHDPDWCVVLEDEAGVVQTMLIGFPVQQTLPDGAALPAIYYYALGTDPAVRGRGYGRALFRYAEAVFSGEGRPVMTLLPGEPSLYDFFLSIGYDDRNFFIRRLETSRADLPAPEGAAEPAGPAEYNALRERYLAGSYHLSFDDAYIRHQKNVARLYRGDLLRLAFSDTDGCASVEYAEDGTLLVKELLVPAGRTTAALAAIAGRFPCENLVANLPAMPDFDELGSLAPYGVTHWMDSEQEKLLSGRKDGYLGLALD